MITKKQYIEYLLSTPINYTCSNLSEHLENVSHDTVTDFLQNSKFKPRDLWELVKNRIDDSEEAFLLVDDSVQNKQYSQYDKLLKQFPSLSEKEKSDLRQAVEEVAEQDVKNEFTSGTEKRLRELEPDAARTYLKALKGKYQDWLARLP